MNVINIIIEQLLAKRAALAAAYKVAPSQAIALEFVDVQRALNAAYCKRHNILNRNKKEA